MEGKIAIVALIAIIIAGAIAFVLLISNHQSTGNLSSQPTTSIAGQPSLSTTPSSSGSLATSIPTTTVATAQSGTYRKVFIHQSTTFYSQITITPIGTTNIHGQVFAILNITSSYHSSNGQLIGQNQYLSFGQNNGPPYILVSQVNANSSSDSQDWVELNMSYSISNGFTNAASDQFGSSSNNTNSSNNNNKSNNMSISTNKTSNPNFIVAVPANLSQIYQISKFRSCEGHNYSGYDTQGYFENNRSMKHYFTPLPQYNGSTDKVELFAPFNGTVTKMFAEHSGAGTQVWIADAVKNASSYGNPTPGIWNFVFFHTNPIGGLAVGSKVTSGELIGYDNMTPPERGFDIALQEYTGSNGNYNLELDSIFNHMSQQVLNSFIALGANQNNMIYSKAYRDANPCTAYNLNPNDTVTLS